MYCTTHSSISVPGKRCQVLLYVDKNVSEEPAANIYQEQNSTLQYSILQYYTLQCRFQLEDGDAVFSETLINFYYITRRLIPED